jgi:hypothetical protein
MNVSIRKVNIIGSFSSNELPISITNEQLSVR